MDTELGAHFGVDLGGFWGRFEGSGGTIWEVGGELGHMYVKKGGGPFSHPPFLARKSGPGSSPGGAQVPSENRPKKARREGEEAM